MDDDILKSLREQERILGEMRNRANERLDELLRDALNPERFLRYLAGLGLDISWAENLFAQTDDADPYVVLGLGRTARDAEIKARYRQLLRKYHPDTATEADTERQFQKVLEAYQKIAKERRW